MNYQIIDYKKRICNAMNYISQNIEKNISLEEIAEAANFSAFHFHRIFKALVGETVAAFTRRLRLELAANRLTSKSFDDITEIALSCGFSSSQNFAKAFRKHFGITASEYRKSKNGNINSNKENAFSIQKDYTDSVFNNSLKNEMETKLKAEVKELPETTVAYVRKIGSYAKELHEQAYMELMNWAGPRKLVGPEKVIGIYWDNPDVTTAENCRFDACIVLPDNFPTDDKINVQTINAGPYAICTFEVTADLIPKCWEEAYIWLSNSGYECNDKPCFERYHNNAEEDPENKWIFDICIPLMNK